MWIENIRMLTFRNYPAVKSRHIGILDKVNPTMDPRITDLPLWPINTGSFAGVSKQRPEHERKKHESKHCTPNYWNIFNYTLGGTHLPNIQAPTWLSSRASCPRLPF